MPNPDKKTDFLNSLNKFLNALKTDEKIKFIKDFIVLVTFYGVIISFTLSRLIQFKFDIGNIIACGLAMYIIKEELPKILFKSFRA